MKPSESFLQGLVLVKGAVAKGEPNWRLRQARLGDFAVAFGRHLLSSG